MRLTIKKIIILLITLISLAGCQRTDVVEITNNNTSDVSSKETFTEVTIENNTLYTTSTDTNNFVDTEGNEIVIIGEYDSSTPGDYTVTATYQKDGEEVSEEITIVVRESQEELELQKQEDEQNVIWEDGYAAKYHAEIDGQIIGPKELYTADLDTAEKWVQQVYGDDYEIKQGFSTGKWYVFVTLSPYKNTCYDVQLLVRDIKANGGHVSVNHTKDVGWGIDECL